MQFWCILHSDKVFSRTLNISQFRHRSQMLLHKKRAGDLKGRTTRSLALILKRIIKHEKFPKARGTTTSSNLLSLYHTSMSLSSPCNKKEPLKALPLTVPHYGRVLRKHLECGGDKAELSAWASVRPQSFPFFSTAPPACTRIIPNPPTPCQHFSTKKTCIIMHKYSLWKCA